MYLHITLHNTCTCILHYTYIKFCLRNPSVSDLFYELYQDIDLWSTPLVYNESTAIWAAGIGRVLKSQPSKFSFQN